MAGFTKTRIVDPSGGGTDTTITDAVTAVSTTGGTVIVEEFNSTGTGYEIEAAITLPDNITIIGRGNVLITVRSDTPAFYASGKKRIVISGFRIKAERVSPSKYFSKVIRLENSSNCIIEKCTIQVIRPSASSAGISLYGSSDGTRSEDNLITECNVSGDSTGDGLVAGIELSQYCSRNMIVNNTVFNCNQNCVISTSSEHNTIMGNMFRDSINNADLGSLYVNGSNYNIERIHK